MSKIPKELSYTKEHEWIKIENDVGVIGITDFAQNALGDIVFVEFPEVGSLIETGKAFGVVESIKSVSDLYSPVTGEVIEINHEIEESPEKINSDSYSSWMIKVKIDSTLEKATFMNASQYSVFCEKN